MVTVHDTSGGAVTADVDGAGLVAAAVVELDAEPAGELVPTAGSADTDGTTGTDNALGPADTDNGLDATSPLEPDHH